MADIVSPETRSRMMSGIKSTNTRAEVILRRGLHARGFRFRLHDRRLPGKPDIIFPRRKAVLFVHGCFWHGHKCHLFKWPSTRADFWRSKIESNRANDRKCAKLLKSGGWRRGVVWECALKGRTRLPVEKVISKCAAWLESGKLHLEIKGSAA